jgi:hypothetical protein
MKILKAMVGSADTGTIYKVDVIEHDNGLWLVPQWYDVPSEGVSKPARIIRMDTLPYQKMDDPDRFGDFILNVPIPDAVLNLPTPKEPVAGFEVHEMPEINFPTKDRTSN